MKNFTTEILEGIVLLILLCSTILSTFQSLFVGIPAVLIIVGCIWSLVRKIKGRLE